MQPSRKDHLKPGAAAVLAVLVAFPCSASPADVSLRWSELSPFVLRNEVTLALPTGTVISGNAVAVRDDALAVEIRRTSDAKAYPKGQISIPRNSVSVLKVTEMRGTLGRNIGIRAGVLVGLLLATTVITRGRLGLHAGVATFIGLPIASGVAGHEIGRQADRRVTLIRIVAD